MTLSHADFMKMCTQYNAQQHSKEEFEAPNREKINLLVKNALGDIIERFNTTHVAETPINHDMIQVICSNMKRHITQHCDDPEQKALAHKAVEDCLSAAEHQKIEVENQLKAGNRLGLYHFVHKFYAPFVERNPIDWNPLENFEPTRFPYNDLQIPITMSDEEISKIWEATGMLQLRPNDPHAENLVIGCENSTLVGPGGENLEHSLQEAYDTHSDSDQQYYTHYRDQHQHAGEVTIAPDLANNPTIIGLFNHHFLKSIFPNHRFNKIYFEGYFPTNHVSRQHCQDLIDLLTDQGRIYFKDGNHEEDITSWIQWGADVDGVYQEPSGE